MKKLHLYVWTGFSPDWTGGLAFAIAKDEKEARKLVVKAYGIDCEPSEWGDLAVYPANKEIAFCVSGGA